MKRIIGAVVLLLLLTAAVGVARVDRFDDIYVDDNVMVAGTITLLVPGTFSTQTLQGEAVGAIVADKCTTVEYMAGTQKTVLTFTLTGDNDLDLADGDHGTGIKVYDLPAGRILILGATINAFVTTSANYNASPNDVFYLAMGTAVGADDNDLTSTEADIIPKTTLDTVGATVLTLDWHAALAASAQFDGTSTAVDLYVNAACADTANTDANTYVITGTVTIHWINLGDY